MEPLKLFVEQNPWVVAALIAWALPWKGVALWKAARNNDKPWFVTLLVIQTLATLEIVYIFFVSPRRKGSSKAIQ